jgi:hypothetical protein
MKIRVVKEFRGAKDGDHHPTLFRVGDFVEGNLADVALAEKWAVRERSRQSSIAAEPLTEAQGEPASEASSEPAQDPAEAPSEAQPGE